MGKNLLHVDGLDKDIIHRQAQAQLLNARDFLPLVGTSGYVWGAALRCVQSASNPVYVSRGHRVSLATAMQVCCMTALHKLPEPVRQADLRSRDFLRKLAS